MGFNILDLLLPRETKFYTYMIEQVGCFVEGSQIFKSLMYSIEGLSPEEVKKRLLAIKECELRGDNIERKIIDELNATFITPLDREDIHTLAINIDRTMDILNSIARKVEIYHINKVPINVCKFADIIVKIGAEMETLMKQLEAKKDIEEIQRKMHVLENEADDLFHNCMEELFTSQHTPVDIIRFKEVYEHLENVVDAVDYIGKVVRGIKVKQG